jgi:hypothetical protein
MFLRPYSANIPMLAWCSVLDDQLGVIRDEGSRFPPDLPSGAEALIALKCRPWPKKQE